MDSTWLVLAALAFGLFLGAGVHDRAAHGRAPAGPARPKVVASTVPDGVDQVLDVLESAGVVLDPSNNVIRASPGRGRHGAGRNQQLVHPELLDIVATVRRTGEPVAGEDCTCRAGPVRRRDAAAARAVGAARHPVRAAARRGPHRVVPARRGATRLRREHQPRTEDPDRRGQPARRGARPAADDPTRCGASPGGSRSRRTGSRRITSEIIELSRLQAREALAPPCCSGSTTVVAAAVEQNRVVADAKGIDRGQRRRSSNAEVYGDRALLASPCTT